MYYACQITIFLSYNQFFSQIFKFEFATKSISDHHQIKQSAMSDESDKLLQISNYKISHI